MTFLKSQMLSWLFLLLVLPLIHAADDGNTNDQKSEFPPLLVEFMPYEQNPIFTGRGPGYWDEKIRERGWILRDTRHRQQKQAAEQRGRGKESNNVCLSHLCLLMNPDDVSSSGGRPR